MHLHMTSQRRTFSRDHLLRLRHPPSVVPQTSWPLGRRVRRALWFHGILRRDQTVHALESGPGSSKVTVARQRGTGLSRTTPICVNTNNRAPFCTPQPSSFPIPVRITKRYPSSLATQSKQVLSSRTRILVRPQICSKPRKTHHRSSAVSVMHFNARSLKNKIDELSLRCKKFNPDVIVISESWVDDTVPDTFLSLAGYDILRCDRNLYGGGIAIYIKDTIIHEMIPLPPSSNLRFKSNILCCRFPALSLLLFGIYHPYWSNAPEHLLVLEYLQECFDDCSLCPVSPVISLLSVEMLMA